MHCEFPATRCEVVSPYPEGYIDKSDEYRHLDEWPDYTDECLAGIEPEDGYSHGNRQLKIVSSSSK